MRILTLHICLFLLFIYLDFDMSQLWSKLKMQFFCLLEEVMAEEMIYV